MDNFEKIILGKQMIKSIIKSIIILILLIFCVGCANIHEISNKGKAVKHSEYITFGEYGAVWKIKISAISYAYNIYYKIT